MADDIIVRFGAQISGLTDAVKEVKESLESVTSPITSLTESFAGIGEALAAAFAVEKIAEFINHITEAGAAVEHMSQILGISAEEVSGFQFAAGAMGISAEAASMALERLERNMVQSAQGTGAAAAAFRALGLDAVDPATGKIKSLDQLLPQIAEKFAQSENGANKTAIAIALFGRAGAQMIPFLNEGTEGIKHFNEILDDTGSRVTTAMAEGMEKTSIATFTLGKAVEGVGYTLYEAFKPAIDVCINGLISLVEGFNDAIKTGGSMNGVLGALVITVDSLIAAVVIMSSVFREIWEGVSLIVDASVARIISDLAALGKALKLDFSGASIELKKGTAEMNLIWSERTTQMVKTATETVEAIKKLFANISGGLVDTTGGAADKGEGGKGSLGIMDSSKLSNQMAEWRAALQQMITEQVGFFQDSKGLELQFWQDKLATVSGNSKEEQKLRQQISQQIYNLERSEAKQWLSDYAAGLKQQETAAGQDLQVKLDIARAGMRDLEAIGATETNQYRAMKQEEANLTQKMMQEKQKIEQEDSAMTISLNKKQLEQKKSMLDEELAAGNITTSQKFQKEKELTDQIYQLDLQTLEQEQQVQGQSLQYYSHIYQQIRALKQQHELDMQKITTQSVQAQMKDYESYAHAITSSVGSALEGLIEKQMTWQQAGVKIMDDMLNHFISMIEVWVDKWLANLAMQLFGQQSTDQAIVASKTAAMTEGGALQIASDFSSIANSAAVAAAGAFAATAAIPYVGPELAPEAAAAAYAATLGWAAGLMPLDVGAWEIPNNSPYMLHAGETVLPKPFAEQFRQNSSGTGGSTVHFNINAIDGASVKKFLMDNSKTIVKAISGEQRNNNSAFQGM